jgi:hypothetical protein
VKQLLLYDEHMGNRERGSTTVELRHLRQSSGSSLKNDLSAPLIE